jgi:Mor family transcriptional regulator
MLKLGPEYPEILAEMAAHVFECLKESGVPKERAAEIAVKAAERVRQNFGGQVVYIPFGLSHEALKRWEEIWAKFTGDNQPQLAREYGCTEVHINRVLRRMREVKLRDVQDDIFIKPAKPGSKT